MPGPTPIEGIHRARKAIRQAREIWDATDLERVGRCGELLGSALAELRDAIGTAAASHTPLPGEARPVLAGLKHDMCSMARVVDACSAFQRGLLLRLGEAAPNYDASGLRLFAEVRSAERVALDV